MIISLGKNLFQYHKQKKGKGCIEFCRKGCSSPKPQIYHIVIVKIKLQLYCNKNIPTIILPGESATKKASLVFTPMLFENYSINCEERTPPFSWREIGLLSPSGILLLTGEKVSINLGTLRDGAWASLPYEQGTDVNGRIFCPPGLQLPAVPPSVSLLLWLTISWG